MLGVGGLSLSLDRAGEGGGGSRGGGHLSRRMLLLERPFLPRFLRTHTQCRKTSLRWGATRGNADKRSGTFDRKHTEN